MSENATQEGNIYEAVAYNDLRKMAADRNLASNGSKEDIIARLLEADANGGNTEGAGEGENGDGSEGAGDAGDASATVPAPVTAPAARPTRTAPTAPNTDEVFKTKVDRIKAALAKQPKVMIFIPFEHGENPEQAAKIQMVVNINGHQFNIPRGVGVEVPQQVAQMVMERLQSEGRAGRGSLISGNPEKETALAE